MYHNISVLFWPVITGKPSLSGNSFNFGHQSVGSIYWDLLALGKERQKSKVIPCTLNPKWREGFDLYWQEDTDDQMEITIWDRDVGAKDDFIGM